MSKIAVSKLKRSEGILEYKKESKPKSKKIVVAVSGGFDPIHIGHVRLFEEAKKLGDELVIILNNDNWLKKKKGFAFMPENERRELLLALKVVDRVMLTTHKQDTNDMSVCNELLKLRPDIFANGGDRTKSNIPEVPVCQQIGCKMIFGIGQGGKIQSSSWLLASYANYLTAKPRQSKSMRAAAKQITQK